MSRFPRFTPHVCIVLLSVLAGTARGEDTKGNPMSYAEARAPLAKHTKLIEFSNDAGRGWRWPRSGRGG